ncbi:MAG: hypothetical protein KA375_01530 [Vitreoscilla sp.]|nr:hypothetical protein [Burkholderiales bacterium]MBP6336248.1 hypothetical protein [Vitreoscilla sp.]MBP6673998.1 hypothetical protein [Vitreoscilla sp.]
MSLLRHFQVTRRVVGVVMLALLLSQWLALGHAVAHSQSSVASQALADDDSDSWGHAAGAATCHLLGHLLTGQAPGHELPVTPPADCVAVQAEALGATQCFGTAPHAFEARGPPQT